jgi:hypothetical protein
VKRLIVLLIVIAGGLAAAAFAVPSNAATVNGVGISQQRLNSDLAAIAKSSDYQCFLNAEEAVGTQGQTGLPSLRGAGAQDGSQSLSTVTASYASNYLNTLIVHQLVFELAAKKHLQVTPQDLTTAHTELQNQVSAILQEVSSSKYACQAAGPATLATVPKSFVNDIVKFDATVSVFEEDQAGVGSTTADLERYYTTHASAFDTVSFTVAQYTSQALAEAALAQVAAGTPFAQVAAQVSGGGPAGSTILYGLSSQLPAGSNLESLPVDTVSSPIAVNSSYLLIEFTARTPTPFAQAETAVEAAVQSAGSPKTQKVIEAAEKAASISVDQRYGQWTPARALIVPPPSPLSGDVLNTAVNSPGTSTSTTTSTSTATTATGQTP